MFHDIRGAVPLSHFFLATRVAPGDTVLDATCGNGNDTLFLARLVGPNGLVWAFDLQEAAVAAARALLFKESCLDTVRLINAGHERLTEFVKTPLRAAVFNLGYLPGGDKEVSTSPLHTCAALTCALELLLPGGIIVIALYSGHPGGTDECRAVEEWAAGLSPREFNSWRSAQLNRPAHAPYLVLVEKRGRHE